jgi:DNA-binding response OmpR family regulator
LTVAPHHRTVVLIVEDDSHLRWLYRSALAAAGFAVVAVEDGIDALRYLDQNDPPAAVVLDLGLPRLDGRDVQREMSAQGMAAQVPIVVVTGEAGPLNEADFACVLRKPIEPDELVTAVQRCLHQARRVF